MQSNFLQLQDMLVEFSKLLSESVIDMELYQLPLVTLEQAKAEQDVINILSTYSNDSDGISFLHKAFTTLKLDALKYSTYLAHRYPGFVVVDEDRKQDVLMYIDEINRRKAEFHLSVNQGYKKRQSAHENLHKLIPNVILLTTTRQIRYCLQPVNTVSFYWQHKTSHKNIDLDYAKKVLKNAKNNPTFEYAWVNKDEKLAFIEQEIEHLSHIPKHHKIVEIRQNRAQPFIDLWTRHENGTRNIKISSSNATLPMILFGEPPASVNHLKNYSRDNVQFKEVSYTLINARKSWYAVPEQT